jgi:hypothetical protein
MRSLLVVCLGFAGVWLLAGPGWALLAGAVLVFALWRREPDWLALRARAAAMARGLAARVKDRPRRATAVGGMVSGIALVPAGLGLSAGAGVAVAAAGVMAVAVSLLTGWGS